MTARVDGSTSVGYPDPADDGAESAGGLLPAPGRSPLLLAFVACVFIALGYDTGMAWPVTGTVVGALGVVGGCCLLGSSDARLRVLGSTIVASGLVGISIAVTVLPSAVVLGSEPTLTGLESPRLFGVLLALAGGVGGVGVAVLVDRGGVAVLRDALRDVAVAAALVTPTLLLVVDGGVLRSLLGGGRTLVAAWTGTPAIALLSLQFLALWTFATAVIARAPVDRFTPWQLPVPTATEIVDRFRSVPELGYWLCFGYVALWFVPGVLPAIDAAIASLGPIGVVVGTLLRSALVHGILVALSGFLLTLGIGYACSPPVRRWLEPTPVRTLSSAAGGVVVPVVVIVGGTAGTDHELVGLGALGSLPLVMAFLVSAIAGATVGRVDVSRRRVLGLATASLFAGVMGLAVDGLSSIGVLVGVATVILAWDLGVNALSMYPSVGPDVDASEPIATHATAVIGVLVVGVFLGGLAIAGATVGGRAITLGAAKATVVLLLGAVLAVATIAVRRPAASTEFFEPLVSRGRWVLSNPVLASLLCGPILLGLWAFVNPMMFAVAIVVAVVILALLLSDPTDDRAVSPRQRF